MKRKLRKDMNSMVKMQKFINLRDNTYLENQPAADGEASNHLEHIDFISLFKMKKA